MNDLEFSMEYIQKLLDAVIRRRDGKRRTIKGFDAVGLEWKNTFPSLDLSVDIFYIEPKGHRSVSAHTSHDNGVLQIRAIRGKKKWKITVVCSDFGNSNTSISELIWVTHSYNDALMIQGITISNSENLKADIMALRLFGIIS